MYNNIGPYTLSYIPPTSVCVLKQYNLTFRNPDSFTPLDIDSLEADTKISNNKDNYGKLNIDPSLNSNDNKSMNDLKSFHHSNYSFYNTGFEGDKENKNIDNTDDSDKTHYPTLEPSLNLTVDAKQHGIVLGTKSFHV